MNQSPRAKMPSWRSESLGPDLAQAAGAIASHSQAGEIRFDQTARHKQRPHARDRNPIDWAP